MTDNQPNLPQYVSRAQVISALKLLGVTDRRITQVIISGENIEFTYPVNEDYQPSEIDETLAPYRFLTYSVSIVN